MRTNCAETRLCPQGFRGTASNLKIFALGGATTSVAVFRLSRSHSLTGGPSAIPTSKSICSVFCMTLPQTESCHLSPLNEATSAEGAGPLHFAFVAQGRCTAEFSHSLTMQAGRAKPKSRRDDMIIARGNPAKREPPRAAHPK